MLTSYLVLFLKDSISVPYDPQFTRARAHYSCLYWGASISAFEYLARKKGYSLICSNSAGNNLFFVRNDRINDLNARSSEEVYCESGFKDSRDSSGKLSFLEGSDRLKEIEHMKVVNVKDKRIYPLSEIENGK